MTSTTEQTETAPETKATKKVTRGARRERLIVESFCRLNKERLHRPN
jgi:hypothetical protein